jgi:hypothetical protein
MVDGLHISMWNKTKKPLAIALSGAREGTEGERQMYNISLIRIVTLNPPLCTNTS